MSELSTAELAHRLTLAQTELDVIAEYGRAIHNPRDLLALYRDLHRYLKQIMPVDAFFVALIIPGQSMMQTQLLIDDDVEYEPAPPWPYAGDRPTGWVIQNAAPIRFADLNTDGPARFPNYTASVTDFGNTENFSHAWMTVPMLIDQSVKGVVNVQSYQEAVYGPHEERLLLTLAGMTAIAVTQADLIAQLEATRSALSAPLIPVNDHLLILPLLGQIDLDRVQIAQQTLLHTIQHTRAKHVLLDLTAVSRVEPAALAALLRMIQAVGLLGAQCTLSGVQADLSQQITSQGMDLGRFAVVRNVQQGVLEFGLHSGGKVKAAR
jgi:rsbT co-antagonist protein RsbR